MPVWILAGFLGSGKTSVLNSLLSSREGRRVGVVVNDFGTLGVDITLIRDAEGSGGPPVVPVAELNGGQIFCSCLSGSFVETVAAMAARDVDALLVESSGLAKPGPLGQIMRQATIASGRKLRYAGMVTVVDADRFTKLRTVVNAVEEQIHFADLIVINKTDLVDAGVVASIRHDVAQMNPRAAVRSTTRGALGWDQLPDIGVQSAPVTLPATFAGWGASGRPVSAVYSANRVFSRSQVDELLDLLSAHTFRVKGYLRSPGGVWFVSASGEQREIEALAAEPAAGDRAGGFQIGLSVVAPAGVDVEALCSVTRPTSGTRSA